MTHRRDDEFIIDSILPKYELHLIGGPPGAGKTTWLFQFIEDWQAGRPVFGHVSHPEPFVYISCDRSERSVRRSFKRVVGSPFEQFPYFDGLRPRKGGLAELLKDALAKFPQAKVFFIEGFARFAPSGNSKSGASDGGYGAIANFISSVTTACEDLGLTIIGIVHSPKMKPKDKYDNPRQRIIGSAAWAGFANSIILVEPVESDKVSPLRCLYLLPRDAPEQMFEMCFDEAGRLVELKNEPAHLELDLWLLKLPPGTELTTATIREQAERLKCGERTMWRWIEFHTERGTIQKLSKGVYKKAHAA